MALQTISLQSICEMDGGIVAAAVNAALKQISDDLINRPADDAVRSVTLKINCKPVADVESGVLDYAEMWHTIAANMPSRRSKTYRAGVGGGALRVNDLSPRNPNQRTIDEASGEVGDA